MTSIHVDFSLFEPSHVPHSALMNCALFEGRDGVSFSSHVPRPDWEFICSKDYCRALWVLRGTQEQEQVSSSIFSKTTMANIYMSQ